MMYEFLCFGIPHLLCKVDTVCWNVTIMKLTEMQGICWQPDTWKTVFLHWGRNKQTVWHTFLKSSYCFTGKQHTDVIKLGIKQNNYGTKKLGHRASGITYRDIGRGLLSASLPLKEQGEPRQDTMLIIYTFVWHLQGRMVYFWIDHKVYGSSGQWCGLDLQNCHTRVWATLLLL